MRHLIALLALALPATMAAQRPATAGDSLLERAREIHKRESLLIPTLTSRTSTPPSSPTRVAATPSAWITPR